MIHPRDVAVREQGPSVALFYFLSRNKAVETWRAEQAMTEMTGAEMVIAALADQGVEHIFGYPGGAVLPIYDALFQQDKVNHILVRHEQGAVHAA
jgi:acetolactate synthase I/II/III large subunit